MLEDQLINNSKSDFLEFEDIKTKQHYHPPHRGVRRGTRVVVFRRFKRSLNPAFISIVLISYIISSQSILIIMSSGKNFTTGHWQVESTKKGSLIGLVDASPAPEPTRGSARSSSSGSLKGPPLNGSIFGKRSVNNLNGASKTKSSTQNDIRLDESRSMNSKTYETTSYRAQSPQIRTARNGLGNYKDIVTEIIEDFLAQNNDNDPDETTEAFCRMIVYECTQMLSGRRKTNARWRRKKAL